MPKKTTHKRTERECRASTLRNKIHKTGATGEKVADAITELREDKLYVELGWKSFNSWAKNDSPWSANYTYKISGTKAPGKPAGESQAKSSAASPVATSSSPAGVPTTVFRTLDKVGQEVPDHLSAVFEGGDTHFITIYQAIADMRAMLTILPPSAAGGELMRSGRLETLRDHLSSIEGIVDRSRPHALCFFCRGASKTRCQACSGKGWLTETQWQDATRHEEKKKAKK